MIKKNILEYDFPRDLSEMSLADKELLSIQIREFLIDEVSNTGGHLASNLGAVEITVAIHSVFDPVKDKIIWDVGHQSYVHKILTGRGKYFNTLRQYKGLSGFPKVSESSSDVFDTGHSSNSLSIATGMSVARDLKNEDYNVISVIGDGSLTGGLAYEGLNNLGGLKTKTIIILNDNGMSISQNTGGLSRHLGKIRLSPKYYKIKNKISKTLNNIPVVGKELYEGISHLKESVKYTLVDGIIFEQLGITYLGPVDGHDIQDLIEIMELAKKAKGPVIIHAITRKGKGYKNAEQNPAKFHGIGPFEKTTGEIKGNSGRTYSSIFGSKLTEMAKKNDKITAVSAAMIEGTGLEEFKSRFSDRCFDVGIAEGHGVTFAGAMAKNGLRPFVAIYSTFLQRAYDQIIMDVALQDVPVVFCIDRAGVVGADGETHHGVFDIPYLKSIPNMVILAPKDGYELEMMMEFALSKNSPVAVRYPRGRVPEPIRSKTSVSEGAEILKKGRNAEIWAVGSMVANALKAAEILEAAGVNVGVVNPRFIKPVDERALIESSERTDLIVTVEDGVLDGGFGETVKSKLVNDSINVLSLGFDDRFIPQGSQNELFESTELNAEGIVKSILDSLEALYAKN